MYDLTNVDPLEQFILNSYALIANKEIPDLAKLSETVYWDYYDEERSRLLEEAIERNEHQWYNLTKSNFVESVGNASIDLPYLEPALNMGDICEMIQEYLILNSFTYEDLVGDTIHEPFEEVW